jgi:hypothetical protein
LEDVNMDTRTAPNQRKPRKGRETAI